MTRPLAMTIVIVHRDDLKLVTRSLDRHTLLTGRPPQWEGQFVCRSYVIIVRRLLRVSVVAAVVATVVTVTMDPPMHTITILRIPLLDLSPTWAGGVSVIVVMMVVMMKLRNLSRKRILLSVLHHVGIAIT